MVEVDGGRWNNGEGRAAPLAVTLDKEGFALSSVLGLPEVRLDPPALRWLVSRIAGDQPADDAPGIPTDEVDRHLTGRDLANVGSPRLREVEQVDPDVAYAVITPTTFRAGVDGFDAVGHDGGIITRLDGQELAALASFTQPRRLADATLDQAIRLSEHALDAPTFELLVGSLVHDGVLIAVDEDGSHSAASRAERDLRVAMTDVFRRAADVERSLEAFDEREAERTARAGRARTRVVPVNNEGHPILSLGLVMAHAEAHDGGRLAERYAFVPDWADRTVPSLTGTEPPAIYLFSNYIWSHAWNVSRSELVKQKSPRSLTIHGGPNTPKYEADAASFFEMNPHVDIAVHGEGEATFVDLLEKLDGCFDDGAPDLSVLRDVPGITFRLGDEIIRTADRERIADLDQVPSPYTSGIFDNVGDSEIYLMTVETNRGCPYGCTFCDWGSATLSRIRKFDLDRVFAELEWCARNRVKQIFIADANFGIFARDVEIARKVVELRQEHGYPKSFVSSYAKNTVKHLREIIEILSGGGVLSTGSLSLQSLDTETLDTIRRSNISVEKYEDLAVEFGNNGLPLVMELMMGLPGSTVDSFLNDLQQVIDREVRARVNPTEVLMNSPLNDPEYRAEHQIELLRPINHDWRESVQTRKKSLIVSTETFTRDEYELMNRYRMVFLFGENFGGLRQIARFVRQATGLTETDFYVRLADDAYAEPTAWPILRMAFDLVSEHMIPPISWTLLIDELHRYLTTRLGVIDDSALATALAVQHALLPARDRTYPCEVTLDHDFAAWHRTMIDAKRAGQATTWQDEVPPLVTFGPATFVVDDPQMVTALGMGMSLYYDAESDWELESPVARPMRYHHTVQL